MNPAPFHDIPRDIEFLEGLIHELDPGARVTITHYVWHGDDLLDVEVEKDGHRRRYQISAARCESMFRVPEILRHDFEALIEDIEREMADAGWI